MAKTAMQLHIEDLHKAANVIRDLKKLFSGNSEETELFERSIACFESSIENAKYHLQQEREQIEKAYLSGDSDRIRYEEGDPCEYGDGGEYYNSKYGGEAMKPEIQSMINLALENNRIVVEVNCTSIIVVVKNGYNNPRFEAFHKCDIVGYGFVGLNELEDKVMEELNNSN